MPRRFGRRRSRFPAAVRSRSGSTRSTRRWRLSRSPRCRPARQPPRWSNRKACDRKARSPAKSQAWAECGRRKPAPRPGRPRRSMSSPIVSGALATLYVMENASTNKIPNPFLYTLASPMVGDAIFVAAFNYLGLNSWQIVDSSDVVPMLPSALLGYQHVATAKAYSSTGLVQPNVGCWHAMATYPSLIDVTRLPDPACRLSAAGTGPRNVRVRHRNACCVGSVVATLGGNAYHADARQPLRLCPPIRVVS